MCGLASFNQLIESWKNLWNCQCHPHFHLRICSLSIFGWNHGQGRQSCFTWIRRNARSNHTSAFL